MSFLHLITHLLFVSDEESDVVIIDRGTQGTKSVGPTGVAWTVVVVVVVRGGRRRCRRGGRVSERLESVLQRRGLGGRDVRHDAP